MDHHPPRSSRVMRPRISRKFAGFAKKRGHRPLLLVTAGGESSHAAAFWQHAGEDRDTAVAEHGETRHTPPVFQRRLVGRHASANYSTLADYAISRHRNSVSRTRGKLRRCDSRPGETFARRERRTARGRGHRGLLSFVADR